MRAVILAGGRGTRLRPYTSVLPKPLMPIGDRAILEIVIEQLVKHGFGEIFLCVGHLSHLIQAVLSQRQAVGVDITYVQEDKPLGTARPLRSVPGLRSSNSPFIAMNGDILTLLDYGALYTHHLRTGHAMTIAMRERVNTVDYGILEVDESTLTAPIVTGFLEKPQYPLNVSMGVYVIEPEVLDLIPEDEPFDVPQLIHALVATGGSVGAFRYDGFWLDIGRPEDYESAGTLWAEANAALDRNGAAPDENGRVTPPLDGLDKLGDPQPSILAANEPS